MRKGWGGMVVMVMGVVLAVVVVMSVMIVDAVVDVVVIITLCNRNGEGKPVQVWRLGG